jgi:hypothetical protein
MLPATLRRAQRNPQRIADKRSRRAFGPGHPFKQRLEPRVHLDGRKIPAPIMARKHPSEPAVGNRLRACRDPEHDAWRYVGGSFEIIAFQASASAVNAAMLAAKTRHAVFSAARPIPPSRARAAQMRAMVFGIAGLVVMGQQNIRETAQFSDQATAGRARPIRHPIPAVQPIATGRSGR